VTPADSALGIALLLLLVHTVWSLFAHSKNTALTVSIIALALLSYGLSQYPQGPLTEPLTPTISLVSKALNLSGGSLLALAAAQSVALLLDNAQRHTMLADHRREEQASEILVRTALLFLAASLAIDTWWLQKVGLGTENDVQQAGIAISWIVHFVALRLRTSPRWRGWPWASILLVGFICTLPILLDVSWLESKLPI
jgi:hypothetical protein